MGVDDAYVFIFMIVSDIILFAATTKKESQDRKHFQDYYKYRNENTKFREFLESHFPEYLILLNESNQIVF